MKKKSPKSVLGVDCSTNSMAFAHIKHGKLIRYGEIMFNGDNVYERAKDARLKMEALSEQFNDIGYVAIEKTIRVVSVSTALKMAFVAGVVISCLVENAKIVECPPISWQSAIGNKVLTAKEKAEIKKEYPDKSVSWYRNKGRLIRKDRTKQWVKRTYGVDIESDNVSDAIGLAWYSAHIL